MDKFQIGLLLMVAGMLTVFAILLIVIYGSRLLITIINKIAPEEAKASPRAASSEVSAKARAVLEAAVRELTAGKGHITNITKIQ
ncbi:MAG: OadG family protein [Candidatus Cryptobacteroides sp.]|nr:OadG family protein [Candidatus Cryptobacteroides sp.]